MNFMEIIGEIQFLSRTEAATLLHVLAVYLRKLDNGEATPIARQNAFSRSEVFRIGKATQVECQLNL